MYCVSASYLQLFCSVGLKNVEMRYGVSLLPKAMCQNLL